MEKQLITRFHKNFEDFVHHGVGVEFWLARDLQSLLGCSRWENFLTAIGKAKQACISANNEETDHFLDTTKMVSPWMGEVSQRDAQWQR